MAALKSRDAGLALLLVMLAAGSADALASLRAHPTPPVAGLRGGSATAAPSALLDDSMAGSPLLRARKPGNTKMVALLSLSAVAAAPTFARPLFHAAERLAQPGAFESLIAPLCGTIIGIVQTLSVLPMILSIKESGSLGNNNPVPYPAIAGNSIAWLIYGLTVKNAWVSLPNIWGACMGLYYTSTVYKFANFAQRQTISKIVGTYMAVFASVKVILDSGAIDIEEKDAYGLMANACLVFFYMAPLATLSEVWKTKDASSINPLLSVCGIINGGFWGAYGLSLKDPYIYVPNLIGVALNTLTLSARMWFGSKKYASDLLAKAGHPFPSPPRSHKTPSPPRIPPPEELRRMYSRNFKQASLRSRDFRESSLSASMEEDQSSEMFSGYTYSSS